MSKDCIFCKIISGDIPSEIVRDEPEFVAFRDVNPQAPVHVLVVPRHHLETVNDLSSDTAHLIGQMVVAATEIAKDEGFSDDGYRLVFNCNDHGGQTVGHIHLHLLGGRLMSWPPG